jgi:hypothetical protein
MYTEIFALKFKIKIEKFDNRRNFPFAFERALSFFNF